ncbi:DUF4082 domain-containing protein [Actinoplanes sp. CA-030573]|uniref:DUF4082 domain-containing protein n=1 Tax=Actinoplanes sp. CA-030573 TaxID=3239898 RepID=UPI003D8A7923
MRFLEALRRVPVRRTLHRRWRPLVAGGASLALLVTGAILTTPVFASTDPCSAPVNPIACENSKPGTPAAEWDDVWGAGDDAIQGFTTDISVNAGQTVSFKIKAASAYQIDIYRLGYYGGDGARKFDTLNPPLGAAQPDCVTNASTEIYDCGNWSVSATWTVPSDAVSGVFMAKLSLKNTHATSQIPFVVRNDSSTSKLFFKTSDATWQAYNAFGGSNFYNGGPLGRALKVSYNRPFATRQVGNGRDFLFSNEIAMIRFLERNGYDVSYTTDVDSDRRGQLIKNHKTFLSVGHDEYWSGNERTQVEAARDAGVNLAFFSGNEVYWKTRWENSQDGSNTPYRTLVCYKETWAGSKIDPSSEWTGTWRDPQFSPPSNGNRPENALSGTMYMSNNTDLAIQVPAEQGKNRFWRNTSVAGLAAGDTATLAPHTVGYESDEDVDNGFRPAGLIKLSTTTGPTPEYLRDFGLVVTPGTTTHNMTLYRAASGALVFGAGTIQWAWGLDENHDGTQSPADPAMQQATINILADMGAQPATLMSGMTAATASTDTVAPDTTITSPADGSKVTNGAPVTVKGTATDAGGGRVAGVEVSTDGGDTWHPATGTASWSYTFISNGTAAQVVKVRAVDDSANIETSPASVTLDLSGASSLFGQAVPKSPSTDDSSDVTLGVKFTPQTDGTVTGVRFYKGDGNTGTHTGAIWSASGDQLRTGTFVNETASGWQTLKFSKPLSVTKNTTYIASYFAPNGHYAADDRVFASLPYKAFPLTAPRSTTSGGNGVYRVHDGFPAENSPTAANYYVDVTFVDSDSSAPSVLSTTPDDGDQGVELDVKPTVLFSKAVTSSSVQFTVKNAAGTTIAGLASYDSATRTATFNPTSDLAGNTTYTVTVTAQDSQGKSMAEPYSWSFGTAAYTNVHTLLPAGGLPQNPSSGDPDSVTLGVKFTPQVGGKVVGIRYYQGQGNSGTHTGTLYSEGGDQLAKVTFPVSGDTGWQSAFFSQPVTVTAGTTYVAAYWASHGNYSYNSGFFNQAYSDDDGYLKAPAGANGVFAYGGDLFPANSYGSTSYWVDPLYVPSGPPPSAPTQPAPPVGAATILGSSTPAVSAFSDASALEVGVKFRSSTAGTVKGLRFYKGTGNTGTHTGTLWSADQQKLATGTFVDESATGWQTILFDTPVTIQANTDYVASYHTNTGFYAVNVNQFADGLTNGALSVSSGGGLYHYGASAFPDGTTNHNFWIDVYFFPSGS